MMDATPAWNSRTEFELKELLVQHLSLALTLMFFLFVSLKLFVIAHGSYSTALALLTSVGAAEVILAVAVSQLPLTMMALILSVDVFWTANGEPRKTRRHRLATGLAVVLVVGGFFLTPFEIIGFVAYLGIAGFSVSRDVPRETRRADARIISVTFVLIAGFLMIRSDGPWLPQERIETRAESYDGFVLQADDQFMTLLLEEDRTVFRIDSTSVTSRRICSSYSREDVESLAGRLLGWERPEYDEC